MEMQVEELDAGEALASFGRLRAARDAAERDIFVLAAHFADLYNVDAVGGELFTPPGGQRAIRVAGLGTPLVLEFAIAEIAGELGQSTFAARRLIGDALETRHRLPRLWARVHHGEVAPWLARKVAQATRGLTPAQAGTVDRNVAPYADGRLPYGRFLAKLEAEVIAADPEAATAREEAAATERFAKVGQSNPHGQKTLYVKTSAAEMARIDATIDFLATALKDLGDPDNEDRRRTKAVLLLANPAEALTLLQAHATARRRAESADASMATGAAGRGTADRSRAEGSTSRSDTAGSRAGAGLGGESADGAGDKLAAGLSEGAGDKPGADPGDGAGDGFSGRSTPPGRRRPGWGEYDDPLPDPCDDSPQDPYDGLAPPDEPPEDSGGSGGDPRTPVLGGLPLGLGRPFRPSEVPPCSCRGGRYTYDLAKLLPQVHLYLHVHTETVDAGNGVARWEGEGPISARYVRDFLGPHARFVIKPVIDPHAMPAVDAYEVPERLREGLHLRTPFDVFPYASNTRRGKQADHTRPYRPGGPPGQTGLHNLGPMVGFHHRVKTHAGWKVEQPFPGVYLWQAPHGSIYLVDNTGTRQLRGPRKAGPRKAGPRKAGPDTAGDRRPAGTRTG